MSVRWFLWSGQCWIFLSIYSWVVLGINIQLLLFYFSSLWKANPFPLSNTVHLTSNPTIIKGCVSAMVRWRMPVIPATWETKAGGLQKELPRPLYGLICLTISGQDMGEESQHWSSCPECAGLFLSGWIPGASPRRSQPQVFWAQSLTSYLGGSVSQREYSVLTSSSMCHTLSSK